MADLFERLKAALADRYVIEREAGLGGMATVYLARDLRPPGRAGACRVANGGAGILDGHMVGHRGSTHRHYGIASNGAFPLVGCSCIRRYQAST